MIAYRDARPEDGSALGAMARQSFVDTFGTLYKPEDLDAFLEQTFGSSGLPADIGRADRRIRLALDGDAIVGFAKYATSAGLPPPSTADDVELKQLYILDGWKGAGIAQALMDWTLEQARIDGAARIVLSVFVDNHRAKRFYARYGFREIGLAPFAVGSQIDDDRLWSLDL